MSNEIMKKGDIVKYKFPLDEAEKNARYILIEDPDIRVNIEYICDLPIRPIDRVKIEDIEKA